MRWLAVCALAGIASGVVGPRLALWYPAVASAAAQKEDEGASRLWSLRSWVMAVEEHEAGKYDPAAFSIVAWTPGDLQTAGRDLVALVEFLAEAPAKAARSGRPATITYQGRTITVAEVQQLLGLTDAEAQRGDANRVLKRGALLHADIAMLAPIQSHAAENPPSADLQDLVFLYRDGRLQGVESAGIHWRMGRMLLDEVRPDPSRDEMVRLWYRSTSARLQSAHAFVYAIPHLARARQLFPGDADLLLYSGSLHECMATPRVQAAALPTQRGFSSGIRSARAELQQAEAHFRQAVKSDAARTEARIRLGRVLDLLGRHEGGASELRRAASETDDALLLYYADLFLGQAASALGRLDEARDSFERAATRYPRAQSPRLALSQLAGRAGDRAGALAAMEHVLDLPAAEGEREDPWWYYNEVHVPDADHLLDEMREAFDAGAPQ